MAGDLTRDEARRRAHCLDVESYAVEVDVSGNGDTFRGITTVRFTATAAETFLDLRCTALHSAVLDGVALDAATHDAGAGRLVLRGLSGPHELRIVADFAYTRDGSGLHRFVDPVDGRTYLHTKFEPADAHKVFGCFDQPDLKATVTWTVTAPADATVVSNSPAQQVTAAGATRRWRFAPTPRIPTYLAALVVGELHEVRAEHRGVPLGLYCRPAVAPHLDAAELLQLTKDGLDFFTTLFDRPLPFPKYDQVFVLEFTNAGAMENPGCVTLSEELLFRARVPASAREARAETVLHELAHMWFGNLVTMQWWDDLWLNEAFATYLGVLALAEGTGSRTAWTGFTDRTKARAYQQDQLPSAHPVAADVEAMGDVRLNFDAITYAKGAAVLRQLAAWVGGEAFRDGLRTYFAAHAWGNTTRDDLLAVLEKASRRDLSAWSTDWLETAGVTVLRPSFTVDGDDRLRSFAVLQEAPPAHPVLRPHRLAVGLYQRTSEGIVRERRVELDVSGARTDVPELVGAPRPDLVLVNDDDLTYAKVRLDPGSAATLVSHLTEIHDPLTRALCWAAAWDMTRDAELAAGEYVRLVATGAAAIGDPAVLETVLSRARTAVLQYSCADHRDADRALLASAVRGHLATAGPGSDEQLVHLKALAGLIAGPDDAVVVRNALDGRGPEGLAVDTDLRWTLLHGLVASGAAGESEIAAELARDPTARGARHAARCRAALPTSEAKAVAWDVLTGGREPSGPVLVATMIGFAEPTHGGLHEPYVARYFAVLDDIWAGYHADLARGFAVAGYPGTVVSEATIAASEAYLAGGPPPPLARLVREGADGVRRALAARRFDAATRREEVRR